jgi:hypothetical protein
MTSRLPLLTIILACFCIWPTPPLCGAEAGTGSPAEELVKVCKGGAPTLAQLKKHYLEWQTQRLLGKLPYPEPKEADLVRAYQRRYKKTLDPAQLARLKSYFQKQLRELRKQIDPLKPDELAKLETWFKARPAFREKLLLALDPASDNVPAGVRVALAIREKYPKESESLENLTLAFATVWDSPKVVTRAMVRAVPELRNKPPEPCPYLDSFGWFVKHQQKMCPWFAVTPWRLQIYLANEGIALSERDYVLANYKFNSALGTIYSKIEYDNSKLKDNIGRLGKNPYTLENLKKFGGVCRDQAYFARSVCRAFGVPAYMASGESNTGGRHAWVGWIINERRSYLLKNHGRYSYDKYFTAEITDPATGSRIYDYLVGIEAKGLSNEKSYDEADLYYRIWREIGEALEPANRTKLLISALKSNAYHREAWLAIGDATASGALPPNSANSQWRYLSKSFTEFPDFIFKMANSFARMHKTAADKYRFYEQTAALFKRLKRQDLVAKLRLEETRMCENEGRKDLAAQVALMGMQECAGEGTQGTELAKKAVNLTSELKKPKAAIQPLTAVLAKTMKTRSDRVNPNYIELKRLLARAYREAGDNKAADRIDAELHRLDRHKD